MLKEVVGVNKLFQSERADVSKLTDNLLSLFRSLSQNIVEPSFLAKQSNETLPKMKYKDYLIPTSSIYFGLELNNEVRNCSLNGDQILYIKERCKTFVCTLLDQVQMRLRDNIAVLLKMKLFNPQNATSQVMGGKQQKLPEITPKLLLI